MLQAERHALSRKHFVLCFCHDFCFQFLQWKLFQIEMWVIIPLICTVFTHHNVNSKHYFWKVYLDVITSFSIDFDTRRLLYFSIYSKFFNFDEVFFILKTSVQLIVCANFTTKYSISTYKLLKQICCNSFSMVINWKSC